MNDNAKVFLGFLTGLFTGVVAGVLLAPEKGDDTRKMLAERAKVLSDDMGEQFNPSIEKITEVAKAAIETVSDYAAKTLKKQEENSRS